MKRKNWYWLGAVVLGAAILVPALRDSMTSANATATVQSAVWYGFDEGMEKAKLEKKKVLVDVYTDWCTWCKKMDAETYIDPKVRAELQKQFILVKLNAESDRRMTFRGSPMSETEFAQAAGVSSYPSTLFIDENQKPITVVPGYFAPNRFTSLLQFIGQDHYRSMSFQEYVTKRGETF